MPGNQLDIERRLWKVADQLRTNSKLKASECVEPILGLVFLRYAETVAAKAKVRKRKGTRRNGTSEKAQARKGRLAIPKTARIQSILGEPRVARAVNKAMIDIERHNPWLRGVLPKSYTQFPDATLTESLGLVASIPVDPRGNVFGRAYELLLGEFGKADSQKGGEYPTPPSLARLIVEIVGPTNGRIFDPACGAGSLLVPYVNSVYATQARKTGSVEVVGMERIAANVRLCKMHLAVHDVHGDIRDGNTYYEAPQATLGQFDFVVANPPFNANGIDWKRLKGDPRFPYGLPTADNANYLWIQLIYSALREGGRAGFVMANSALDARGGQREIRRKLLTDNAVDVVISIAPQFFYAATLLCSLWFFDRGKARSKRKDTVLFIDARSLFQEGERGHREFSPQQVGFLANIVRLYRGERPKGSTGTLRSLAKSFPGLKYADVPGLCSVESLGRIEQNGWSFNPGRYVGIAKVERDTRSFRKHLKALEMEFRDLSRDADRLTKDASRSFAALLGNGEARKQ